MTAPADPRPASHPGEPAPRQPPPPAGDARWRFVLLGVAAGLGSGALFVVLGFATHRSAVAQVGPYTVVWLAFMGAVALLLILPPGILLALGWALGPRRALHSAAILTLAAVALYAVAEVVYAASRKHTFDPFLQFPGTRFDSIPRTPSEGTLRIMTLGGSTTANLHLPWEERYPAVLQERLNAAGEGAHQVLNAGMDWWTTKHSHINYVTYLRGWRPGTVVVMHAINDLYRSCTPSRFSLGPYDPQWTHFYGPSMRGARPRTLAGSIFQSWTAWEMNRRWYAKWRFRELELGPEDFPSLVDFESSLRSLVTTLKADGVRVVVMTQPSLYRATMEVEESSRLWFAGSFCVRRTGFWGHEVPSAASMAQAMERFNLTALRVASQEGVEGVDAASALPRTLEFFADDVHYTREGASALAALAAAAIRGQDGPPATYHGPPPPR